MPDASDLYAAVVVVVEDVYHRFGPDEVDFSRGSGDKLAICGEIAWVDLGAFYVFFENFHSTSRGR